jgi:hypothetical protein
MRKCGNASIAYRVPAPGVVRDTRDAARGGRAESGSALSTDADGPTGESHSIAFRSHFACSRAGGSPRRAHVDAGSGLRARWVTLSARWVALRARWVT